MARARALSFNEFIIKEKRYRVKSSQIFCFDFQIPSSLKESSTGYGHPNCRQLSSQRLSVLVSPPGLHPHKEMARKFKTPAKYLTGKAMQTIFNFCPFPVPFILLHASSLK